MYLFSYKMTRSSMHVVGLFIYIIATLKTQGTNVLVNTTKGPVQGEVVGNMTAFVGIPYAKPPIDDLRFMPPQEPDPWNATLELDTNFMVRCLQIVGDNRNEDCLYLNVYTPIDAGNNETTYQVMVFIHGGAFLIGSGFDTDPQYFIEHSEGVIIVSINYRLGLFGFFYDNDYNTGVEGNLGLEDQIMAIDWVYDNIAYFGGDPSNINIFGGSAGAISVGFHLLHNNDHIASGIMESPNFVCSEYKPEQLTGNAERMSNAVGCDTTLTASELLKCWQSANTSDLLQFQNDMTSNFSMNFQLTIHTDLLPNYLMTDFARNDLDIPPFIIGNNKNEWWLTVTPSDVGNPDIDNYEYVQYQTNQMNGGCYNNLTVTDTVLEHYGVSATHPTSSGSYIYDAGNILTDLWVCGGRNILNNLAEPNIAYYYNLEIPNLYWGDSSSGCWNKTCHGADKDYLFMGMDNVQYVDEEVLAFSQSMRDYWINFATNHDPNMGVSVAMEWPTFDQSENILILDTSITTESTTMYGVDVCNYLDEVGYVAPFQIHDQSVNVLVNTTKGPVQGEVVGNMTAFVGIPYAKPPINDLRFESPEDPDPWNTTLELDPDFEVQCHELPSGNKNNEDCLYLNVYTPVDAEYNKTSYQVMVWIHGGAFVLGSSYLLDPQYFIEHSEGVIVVSINYRLGLFGFFYDNDYNTGVEGNLGLEDQIMAIDWVYDNIAYFGGDPSNINIFGESAGAVSVAFHLLYNNDRIASGIMQSPTFVCSEYKPEQLTGNAESMSNAIGCDTSLNASELLECWQTANVSDLLQFQSDISSNVSFQLTISTDLFPDYLMDGFARDDLNIPPFINGNNKNEWWFPSVVIPSLVGNPDVDNYDYVQNKVAFHGGCYNNLTVADTVLDFYGVTPDHPTSSGSYMYDAGDISTDQWICGGRNMLNNLVDQSTAYYYNLEIPNLYWGETTDSCWNKTCHTVDINYLFMGMDNAQYVDEEVLALSQSMRDYWVNFARNHDPNIGVPVAVEWPTFDQNENILILDKSTSIESTATYGSDVCNFLDEVGYLAPFTISFDNDNGYEEKEGFWSIGMIIAIAAAVLIALVFIGFASCMLCSKENENESMELNTDYQKL